MSADTYSTRWRVLALLGFAELLGMSLWFSASAVTPQLRSIWGLTTAEAGWLTTIVQFGFVCGTAVAAVLNLADLVPAGRFFSICALLGAAAGYLLARLGLLNRFWAVTIGSFLGILAVAAVRGIHGKVRSRL